MLRPWSRLLSLVSSRFSAGRLVLATLAALFVWLLAMALGLFSPAATRGTESGHREVSASESRYQQEAGDSGVPLSNVAMVAPPGCDLYIAQRGDSLPSVARKYLQRTKYLTSSELTEAIHQANPNRKGVFLKSGEPLIIPGMLDAPIVRTHRSSGKRFRSPRHLSDRSDGGQRSWTAHHPTLARGRRQCGGLRYKG